MTHAIASRSGKARPVPTAPLCIRPLLVMAWINVVLHAGGLALAAWGMRPGTPAAPLAERMQYVAANPTGWLVGWCTWFLCGVALVSFLALAAVRLQGRPAVGSLAVALAAAGLAVDGLCDAGYITALPMAAARRDAALFVTLERLFNASGTVVANGLYCLGVLLLSAAMKKERSVPPAVWWIGGAMFACGMGICASGFTDVHFLLEVATGPTIVLYCLWALAAARALER